MSPRPTEPGFTLLEVLVALVIVGLATVALVQGALGGLQAARISGHYDEALVRARSRLAALGAGTLAPGVREGDDGGGFRWRTSVAAIGMDAVAPGGAGLRPALFAVAVAVSWSMDGGTRSVSLESERVGLAAAAPP